jgi:hypothetical protein
MTAATLTFLLVQVLGLVISACAQPVMVSCCDQEQGAAIDGSHDSSQVAQPVRVWCPATERSELAQCGSDKWPTSAKIRVGWFMFA